VNVRQVKVSVNAMMKNELDGNECKSDVTPDVVVVLDRLTTLGVLSVTVVFDV